MADYRQDNRRLGFAIICATLLHVMIGVGTLFIDWSPSVPPQDFGPVYVEFESLPEIAQPEPIRRPEPVRPDPVPVQPQVAPEPTVQPTPPPQVVTPPQPQATPPAPPAPPAAAPRPQPAPAPQPTAPPPPAHAIQPQEWDTASIMGAESTGTPRERLPSATESVDPTATDAVAELPAWAGQVLAESGISTAAMDQAQVVHVARRVDSDSRFRDQLQAAIQAVRTAPTTRPAATGTSGSDGSAAGSTSTTPGTAPGTETGDGVIRWTDAAGRGGVPSKPRITAEMFGGTVPGRVEFVVLFDVNSRGQVVPGSLVFQTPSGYTRVNEEVRRTISGWTFQPKPGAPVESAIFTLIVFREDVL